MPTVQDMLTSLEDTRFFNDEIEKIVRGPQSGHDLTVVRRYFRGYLHCWKTVLHFVRDVKGFAHDRDGWIRWCAGWGNAHLDAEAIATMTHLRETRDYDTHSGTLIVNGEVAAGLYPLVFVDPVKRKHVRRELVTFTRKGLEIAQRLIETYEGHE